MSIKVLTYLFTYLLSRLASLQGGPKKLAMLIFLK